MTLRHLMIALVLVIQTIWWPLTSQQTANATTITTTTPDNTVTTSATTTATTTTTTSDVVLEFDESDVRNLNLKLKWKYIATPNDAAAGGNSTSSASIPTRFVLLMETKRINFSTFLFDYSSPQLIDDEQVIKASMMKVENFKKRVVLYLQSSLDCSINCINSTKYSTNEKTFECNIFYYDSTTRTCVLYEYDFVNDYPKKEIYQADEIYEYFNDECDMDEILGDVVGYSRLCKRILDYRDEHVIKINPYIDYRFSISLRNEKNEWTPFLRREYQYAPKITIDVRGDIKLGNNITLECKTELSESIVDSITWKSYNPNAKGTLTISPLTVANVYQTYYCEIRFNFFRMIQKAFRLNATNLGDLKPVLKLNYSTDVESLNVTLNWNVKAPIGSQFNPEKMILLYSENNGTYKFVNKYLLFELSKFDNARLASARDSEDITTTNEDECAMSCLQKSFCDHFVFIRSIEPFRSSKRKNCRLVTNTHDDLFPCRYDLICANLSPFEKHVQNNTINVLILPNITYRFKIQLKDKHLNWTDVEETEPIFIPLKIKLDQIGTSTINSSTSTPSSSSRGSDKFELVCQSNINRNIQHQISWTRDDKELVIDGSNFSTYSSNDTQHAHSVLVFARFRNESVAQDVYKGVYKCSIYIRYPEVGQGTSYLSEGKFVQFTYNKPLSYERSEGNISLPTVPGLLLELNCQVSGQPINSVKWLIDGVNLSDKNKRAESLDNPFIINITDPRDSSLHTILVMKIDTAKQSAKYECILNDNTVVKSHYIEIIDQKPELDINIDKSSLNRLKLSIDIKLKNKPYVPKYVNLYDPNQQMSFENKPLKFFILYAENSTVGSAVETTIASNTLSRNGSAQWKPSSQPDKIKLGSLKPVVNDLRSCKIVCFNTPFCRAYEYAAYDDSCNFYSDASTDDYYKSLINKLRNSSASSGNFTFKLIHWLQPDLLDLIEEKELSNITINDPKSYAGCQSLSSSNRGDDQEATCGDQLAEFTSPYVMTDLVPMTSYQFRIELMTAFGKSRVYMTETVQVPFELRPLMVAFRGGASDTQYSLKCATPLLDAAKLKFAWLKNDQRLRDDDKSTYEILAPAISSDQLLVSEIVLKSDVRTSTGYYTCSLTYISGTATTISKNQSIIFRPNIKPNYTIVADQALSKFQGDMWTDSCSAQGWPLPNLRWRLNNRLVSNQTDQTISIPYTINHHRNLTVVSYVIAQNLTLDSSAGKYTCWLNDQVPIKSVTLIVRSSSSAASSTVEPRSRSTQNPPEIDPDQDSSQSASDSTTNGKKNYIGIVAFFITITFLAAISILIYFKRKPPSLNASFAYNPLEEQIVTGVDNINLTDDNC